METKSYIMLYKISCIDKNREKIRILGDYFCRNNNNKGILIINNKKAKLKEYIEINTKKENQIKIKLELNKNICDKSYMFKDCNSLLGLTIVDKLKYVDDHEKIESYLSKCGRK